MKVVLTCGADDKFSMPLAVTLYSALVNCKSPVQLFILDGGISQYNKRKIEKVLNKAQSSLDLHWIGFDMSSVGNLFETDAISKATYLRIMIPKLLPQEVTSTIYLDSDLIIEKDLSLMAGMDFGGLPVMGVQDFNFRTGEDGNIYCNAGVINMNLEVWRRERLDEKIMAYIQANNKHDQDGINALIKGAWKLLDPRWNVTLSSINEFRHDELTVEDLLKEPYIIHYTSRHKPWHTGYRNGEAQLIFYHHQRERNRFFHYLKESGFFGSSYPFWYGWRKLNLTAFKVGRKVGV